MAWSVAPHEPKQAQALAAELGLHPVTAQCLLNRGLTTRLDGLAFLHPSLRALDDPFRLPDMAAAVDRLNRAITRQEPIALFTDSDVDGLTGGRILFEALRELGATVTASLANRIADGYGLPDSTLKSLCASSVKVAILIDCGTNQPDVVRQFAARDIDTIIVDHHVPLLAADVDERAGRAGWAQPLALVNPHRDEAYARFQGLSSAGLALKVAHALFGDEAEERLVPYLDLAALGTLADCAPLIGDARTIVVAGLPRIVQSARPGLRRLCEATGTTHPEPGHILRKLTPRLNASGRLGDCNAIWQLLAREPAGDVRRWLDASEAAHTTTKQLHRQILGQAHEQVNRMHFRDQLVVVISREGWHQGLMGPVASQIAEMCGRPAIAIAMNGEQGTGSGRSVPNFNLLSVLRSCEELLVRFGGHAQACGVTISKQNIDRFRALVNQHAKASVGSVGFTGARRRVDVELPLEAIASRWVEELQALAPFGQGNPRPTVLLRQVAIESVSPRTGYVGTGRSAFKAKGRFPDRGSGEKRFDAVVSPVLTDGEITLTLLDAKDAVEPSPRGRTSGTPCTPASA